MGFLSSLSKGDHYRKGNYGSNYYQRSGILGDLFRIIASRSRSREHYHDQGNQYHNIPTLEPAANQNVIICSKCNARIPNGSKFCLQCGEKVSDIFICVNCGEKLPPHAKFCAKCGNRVNE